MNCQQIRRLLYAFADGELGVKDNCEVLDHLKMCPECTRAVADQQALRGALRTHLLTDPVPSDLRQSLHMSIEVVRGRDRRRRLWRWVPIAAAAAVGGVIWLQWYRGLHESGAIRIKAQQVAALNPLIREVIDTHIECVDHRKTHQSKTLPTTLEGLRDVVAARFGDRMEVLVPDFADLGYRFESVNLCGIEEDKPGVHIMYRCDRDGTRLSFFNVPRCKLCCRATCTRGRQNYFYDAGRVNDVAYAVAGWQCCKGRTSYFACAPLPAEALVDFMTTARMALLPERRRPSLALSDGHHP